MTIHQLVASAKDKGHVEIQTKCGYTVKRKGNEAFPDDVSGWDSQVTCPTCKPAQV